MKNLKYVIFAGAVLITAAVSAQDLSTEVVVERSIKPTERSASRLSGLWPSIVMPQTTPVTLSTANYNQLAEINKSYSILNPAPGEQLPLTDMSRGYFAIGYFPTYNLGISAGYRAIADYKTTLDLWAQFDGTNYNATENEADGKMKYNGILIGADLTTALSNAVKLDASLNYQYANSEAYWRKGQSLNAGTLDVELYGNSGALSYNIGVDVGIDAYGNTTNLLDWGARDIQSFTETEYGIEAGAGVDFMEDMSAGIGVEADMVGSFGIIQVKPYYTVEKSKFSASIGLNWGILTEGNSKFTLSPEIKLNWTPLKNYALQLEVTGGPQHNTWRKLRAISPFVCATHKDAFEASKIPLDARLSMLFGPFEGFSMELFGGYAHADNWLMASVYSPTETLTAYDVSGWRVGVQFNYQYRWIKAMAGAQFAPSDVEEGYYLWRDRAEYVINAGVEVRPIEPLTIGVDYEFRGGRKASTRYYTTESMRSVNNLGLKASYRITPAIAVFATGENLINHRYTILPGIEAQAIAGLLGVNFKF